MTDRGLPTRLVDVSPDDRAESIRLAIGSEITGKDTQFAALSHCWGDNRHRVKAVPKTKIDTLQRHLHKIEWEDLTPTFRDTIAVVRRLGLKYIGTQGYSYSGTFKTKTLKSLRRVVTPASRVELWYNVVEPYSACALHDERDRLPALSGFAGLVASTELGEYCAGLWRHEFPSGLLWRVVRAPPGETQTYRPEEYCGPSWSWIAVRARVEAQIGWHSANEVVAEVLDVQTIPTSLEDRFGAVDAAFLILAGPAVHVTLQQESSGHQQTRDCLMSLAHKFKDSGENHTAAGDDENPERAHSGRPNSHNTSRQPFELDVPAAVDGQQAVCIAVERWHPRINSGQGTCLVLQAVPDAATYSRLGVSFCPASWFQAARRMEVKIV
ncbi:hypothetical protein LTS13_002353 [Exophiala xenobiotica]|nr:hypothetical protein LTS13_002353 [Exophiala xenobiotica]KAK5416393.1 hypothetical protein LTR90_005614 [Exophiala xenobiotica]KAK5511935.1 hypothetical protein LTR21_006352 [Exophiala xenobiotica]